MCSARCRSLRCSVKAYTWAQLIQYTQHILRAAFILLAAADILAAAETCILLHRGRSVYANCVAPLCILDRTLMQLQNQLYHQPDRK
jgi:hypothetical protein